MKNLDIFKTSLDDVKNDIIGLLLYANKLQHYIKTTESNLGRTFTEREITREANYDNINYILNKLSYKIYIEEQKEVLQKLKEREKELFEYFEKTYINI